MKVTIREIAQRAGVHQSTVDKVLHNRVGVSDKVRVRVQSIIEEMGYRPNPMGQILQKQGKTYHIAAILVDVDALELMKQGIEKSVSEHEGFDIEISYHISKFQDVDVQLSYIDRAIEEQVSGIVLNPINSEAIREAINRAEEAGIIVVTTNSDITGSKRTCCVSGDNIKASQIAGRLMGKFLQGKGKIAVISSAIAEENNNYYVQMREKYFSSFMKESYPDINIAAYVESFENPEITYKMTKELLKNTPDLKGIYITCGGAAQVGRALIDSGRHKEVCTFSFEDYPEIKELIKQEVIDCTISSEIIKQGEIPINVIMDYLVFGNKPESEQIYTDSMVLVKESIV